MSTQSSKSVRVLAVAAAAVALLVLLSGVSAYCPSNGNTHAIYITSNMGDNIWSFDTQGNYIGEVINRDSFPPNVQVDKLRSMRFGPGGHLYVSSARGSYSRIFAISGNGLVNGTLKQNCTRDYLFTATALTPENPFLDHPYDMLFHPDTNDLYVSNQNTATITRYLYTPGKDGHPAWVPAPNVKMAMPSERTEASWQQQQQEMTLGVMPKQSDRTNATGGILVGGPGADTDPRVVPPAEMEAPEKIPERAGLFASSWNGKYYLNSVRGLALSPKLPRSLVNGTALPGVFTTDNSTLAYYLLVCDIATNVVHVFDADSGERLFGLWVPSPVQVMFPSRYYDEQNPVAQEGNETSARVYEQPYVLVTSKEDSMTYMVRFSSRSSAPTTVQTQSGIFIDDRYHPSHRVHPITRPTPLHAGSGIYENPSRDIILVADRNGRKISTYASPYAYGGTGPSNDGRSSPFLGYFVKRLPDQPEFILDVLVEHQRDIPFCYELTPDGSTRYVALCAAAYVWSGILLVLLFVLPAIMLCQCGRKWLRERGRREELLRLQKEQAEAEAATPLLTEAQARSRNRRECTPLLGAIENNQNKNYGTS